MKSEKDLETAPWWRRMITRREANAQLVRFGATAALLATAGIAGCGESEEEGTDVERDALELQQKEGWNVGSTDRNLPLANKSTSDSRGSLDWSAYLNPDALVKAYAPKNSTWQPYMVVTLAQALGQSSLRGQIKPTYSRSMEEAYARGLGMREILMKSKNPETTMLVVDLPGPEAVAYGAALADVADPIITFDNWPHPLGVVPSQATLGAMLYYAGEIAEKSAKRKANAPAALLLDANRLAPFNDPDNEFDNRYLAKIPAADKLTAAKITSVMYAVPDSGRTTELDDINEDFALYKEKGLNVSMVALTDFQPDKTATQDTTRTTRSSHGMYHSTYYYGGGAMFAPWFFYHYPMYSAYNLPSRSSLPATSLNGRSYTPSRRPTMFSSRTVGGSRSGVGRQRPTGFGRVSTRVGSDGRTSGVRAGSSGSFGRSRSGYSS